jgi:hypothetical protein
VRTDDETLPDSGSSGKVEVFEAAETSRLRLLAGLAVIGLGIFTFLALTLPELFPPGWLERLFGPATSLHDLASRLIGLFVGTLIAAVGVFLSAMARYLQRLRITVSAQGIEYIDRDKWIVAAWPEVQSLTEQATPDGGRAYTVATANGDFRFQSRTLPAADRLAALIRRRTGEDSHD